MAGMEPNPYAQPKTVDSGVPAAVAEDGDVSPKVLRLAGALLASQACLKLLGLQTTASALLGRVDAGTDLAHLWPILIALVPSTVGFAIPLVLGVALLLAKARYRKVAWIYADIVAVLGVVGLAVTRSLADSRLPMPYLVALCTQKIFFAAAVSLLLVGRPGKPRLMVAALFAALFVVNVFGMGWFLPG
jgi:hypothetical protein